MLQQSCDWKSVQSKKKRKGTYSLFLSLRSVTAGLRSKRNLDPITSFSLLYLQELIRVQVCTGGNASLSFSYWWEPAETHKRQRNIKSAGSSPNRKKKGRERNVNGHNSLSLFFLCLQTGHSPPRSGAFHAVWGTKKEETEIRPFTPFLLFSLSESRTERCSHTLCACVAWSVTHKEIKKKGFLHLFLLFSLC